MTAHARKPTGSRIAQADREPVSTYEQAVWRLVAVRNDPETSDHTYDTAVQLVADVFWRSDCRVRRDVRVAAAELDPPPVAAVGVRSWARL